MTSGIYIIANDRVTEQAIALLNSIRLYDPQVPIFLVPFNENYSNIANIAKIKHQVEIFPNLEFLDQMTQKIGEIFDKDFLNLPNKMRKLVLWFGPLDEFLYIDADIVVFEPLSPLFQYFSEYDFLCCDYHHKGRKLQDIFSPVIQEQHIFTDLQLQDVFNSGFWGSKKNIFSESELYELLKECAAHREYFDFSSNTTDQPILNYLILKTTQKRLNLTKLITNEPGSWAGSPHFKAKNHILYDGQNRLRYLHWAGIAIKPGCPYWKIWEHYRYLGEKKPSLWQKLFS